MKSSYLASLAVSALLAFSAPAFADGANIAVVNIQQIMRDSTAAKSVREQLENKKKSFQSEITKKQDSLQKEEQELKKQQGVLAKDAFASKVASFQSKVTEAQKETQNKEAMLNNAFERSINEIQKAVTDIVADLSKDKGFNVAVPTSQLLYADSKLDISDEVLKRLNDKLPKVDVHFDSGSDKSGK